MTDDQDIFDSEVPEAPQTTEGVSPEAPQPRDESGRFASKDQGEAAEAAPAMPDPGAPPAPAEKTRHDVPISALLDERDKRQSVERQLAELRAQLRQQQQPQRLPDPVEDAEGYAQSIQQAIQQQVQTTRLQMSQFLAEEKFGSEVVAEAMAYFDKQPYEVSAQFLRERSPFHAAVSWYQRQKEVEERSAPDFESKLREKIKAELMAEMQAAPQSTRPNVPRSLAEAPSAAAPPPKGGDPLFD